MGSVDTAAHSQPALFRSSGAILVLLTLFKAPRRISGAPDRNRFSCSDLGEAGILTFSSTLQAHVHMVVVQDERARARAASSQLSNEQSRTNNPEISQSITVSPLFTALSQDLPHANSGT